MASHSLLPVAVLAISIATLGAGCHSSEAFSSGSPRGPVGLVAKNAAEAWPSRPGSVRVLDPADVARACVAYGECGFGREDAGLVATPVDLCVANVLFSGERATPLSDVVFSANERAEFFVECVLAAHTCAERGNCLTARHEGIECQEDGCNVRESLGSITCSGTVATFERDGVHFTRDCARALAECDPGSGSGCTDRPFTQCPSDLGKADHCDGNIRLGCDSAGQVSYHDCERLGGTCGKTPDGKVSCLYPESPECPAGHAQFDSCSGTNLSICVAGRRVTEPAPMSCPGTP
jgi:hypothetical protein